MLKKLKQCPFSDGILLLALLLVGSFHEYISCFLAVAMCIWLIAETLEQKRFRVRKDLLTSSVVAVCLGYALTCLWGIDRGMAFVGFVKYLPLLLYLFCLQQEERASNAESILPWAGAVMTLISAVGMQFPSGKELFGVAGRLAGFFQYPNTFAAFLLVCQLMILKKQDKKIWDYVLLAVLIAGLLYTGSRTVFVLAIVSNAALLLSMTRKKVRLISLAVMGGICVLGLLLALNPQSVLHRYLSISLTESTFAGRVLYWMDALPLLLKYPFGMGYMGYYYIQQSVQTGVYSVVYVHNDFLQLLLDIGLLPAGLFIGAVVAWFFKKTVSSADKIITGTLCLHILFDFDLQFGGMFFLLLWLLSRGATEKVLVLKPKLPLKVGFVAALLACLYMGTALCAAHWGAWELSDAIYPYNTQNKLTMLEQEKDLPTATAMAEEILKQNTTFGAPYSFLAKDCYSRGEFSGVIENAHAAIERNPFGQSEYKAYCQMLMTGIDLYEKAGDFRSAELCKQELLWAAQQLASNTQRLSKLGKLIDDQPITTLPSEIQEYIDTLEGDG